MKFNLSYGSISGARRAVIAESSTKRSKPEHVDIPQADMGLNEMAVLVNLFSVLSTSP